MISIITYFWQPDPGSKFAAPYTPDDVRLLQRMVARHLTVPHQFVVITDRPECFVCDQDIRAVDLDRTTHVPGTCFVRLFTFSPEAYALIGDKVLQIDLDTIIVGNIDHLVTRQEDLVLWRNPARIPWADADLEPYLRQHGIAVDPTDRARYKCIVTEADGRKVYLTNQKRCLYNTSLLFHRCGTRPELWEDFEPMLRPAKDDQWYLSDVIGEDCPFFNGERDGVYRLPREDTPDPMWVDGKLPGNACVVTFAGSEGKADNPRIAAAHPWIREHRC